MNADTTPSLAYSWGILAASITSGSFAQITLKHLTNTLAKKQNAGRLVAIPWLGLWVILFGLATVCWLMALRHLDISYAYPLLSLGYVLVTSLAALLLDEHVSRSHWLAIGLITCGAALVAGSI
ncbi:EamA family transporter [Terriglobus albidus]|uniref:EamA family transporter n=1 Tax=Terriglobus albidus TaxID=1592106 RepID=A0A5B9E8R7_9BACT|nr:EamA family transporter [Terriglobus albidus]QEE28622.1 EamA family transporter [Terriglobus albidus]